MKLALIPPISLCMEYMAPQKYSLLLPDLYDDDDYELAAYRTTSQEGSYSILDNGAAEGNLTGLAQLCSLARFACVEEIVVPDVLTDAEQSMRLLRQADAFVHSSDDPNEFAYMAVLQGKTVDELVDYASKVVTEHEWVKTLGIPRHIAKTCDDRRARLKVLESLSNRDIHHEVDLHLLGADYAWPGETLSVGQHYKDVVRGQDTSLPFVYAHYGKRIKTIGDWPTKRPDDYFNLFAKDFNKEILEYNTYVMREWADGIG